MKKTGNQALWVFAEQHGGEIHDVSLELLGKARELAEPQKLRVEAVLLGHQIGHLAQTLVAHGADTVWMADDDELAFYRLLPYTHILGNLIQERAPDVVLMGATPMGVELAPRVAARMGTGLSAHCIDLRWDAQGQLLQVVPGWGGGVIATISCPHHRPQMATLMPGAMRAQPAQERDGEIKRVDIRLPDTVPGPEVLEVKQEKTEARSLEKADVVVAGGWGIGSQENWRLIEELAGVLGGAVGATRPPVDEGWAQEDQMIGQSGKTIRPTLYIGVGISGVMHHVVGMDQSTHVICINSDEHAEIGDTADVIVVEDFLKILPPLIDALRSRTKTG